MGSELRHIIFILFAGLTTFISHVSIAQTNKDIAQCKFVKGQVFKISAGELKESLVKQGDGLKARDSLRTEEKSLLSVLLIDGSTLTIGPKSKFSFRSFVYDEKSKRLMDFDLVYGQLRGTISKKVLKENRVRFDTRTVSLGIRGTEILFNHRPEKGASIKEVSEVALLSGEATLRYKSTGKNVVLRPGDYLVAMANPIKGFQNHKMHRLDQGTSEALASSGSKFGGLVRPMIGAGEGEMALAGTREKGDGQAELESSMTEEEMSKIFLQFGEPEALLKK